MLSFVHFDALVETAVPDSFLVTVPATTANIGPGFDCLGAALTLYNRFRFTALDAAPGTLEILISGKDADRVSTEPDNLAYQAFDIFYQKQQQATPAVCIEIELDVPLARGLGSSSTAIVGGLLGANAIADYPLTSEEITNLAIAIEGHPDNVVPAILGGCHLAAQDADNRWVICDVPWHDSIKAIVAVPDFELSTVAARKVLPTHYTKADAIFNMAHLGMLLRGLETGNEQWLKAALRDRIHQPYRQTLIPGFETVQQASQAAGACGLVISGAGPTLLAITKEAIATSICNEMLQAWQNPKFKVDTQILSLDFDGALIEPN